MAFVDRNGNGKNDIEDDFIEYQIYQNSTKNNNTTSSGSHGDGISTFGAILCVATGWVIRAIIYEVLGIDVEKVPVIVIIILWAVGSTVTAVVAEKIGL